MANAKRIRYGLGFLLTCFAVFAVAFAVLGYRERQRLRVQRALIAITDLGVDVSFADFDNVVVTFKNGNVTDEDLMRFIPAFRETGRIPGFGRITKIRLCESRVSDAAVSRFRNRVTWCDVIP